MFGFFGNHLQPRHPMKRIDYDPAVRIREPAEHPHCWRAGFVSVCSQADSVLGGCGDGPCCLSPQNCRSTCAGWVWGWPGVGHSVCVRWLLCWVGVGTTGECAETVACVCARVVRAGAGCARCFCYRPERAQPHTLRGTGFCSAVPLGHRQSQHHRSDEPPRVRYRRSHTHLTRYQRAGLTSDAPHRSAEHRTQKSHHPHRHNPPRRETLHHRDIHPRRNPTHNNLRRRAPRPTLRPDQPMEIRHKPPHRTRYHHQQHPLLHRRTPHPRCPSKQTRHPPSSIQPTNPLPHPRARSLPVQLHLPPSDHPCCHHNHHTEPRDPGRTCRTTNTRLHPTRPNETRPIPHRLHTTTGTHAHTVPLRNPNQRPHHRHPPLDNNLHPSSHPHTRHRLIHHAPHHRHRPHQCRGPITLRRNKKTPHQKPPIHHRTQRPNPTQQHRHHPAPIATTQPTQNPTTAPHPAVRAIHTPTPYS